MLGSFRNYLTILSLLLGSGSWFRFLWLSLDNDLSSVFSQFYLTNRTILQNVCKVFYALNQGCLQFWFVLLLIHRKFYLTLYLTTYYHYQDKYLLAVLSRGN